MNINKNTRSLRRSRTQIAIAKQQRIAKDKGVLHTHNQPHRYSKKHALNCGIPSCAMCGNPRKFFKERTIQEKKFFDSFRDLI